MRKPQISNHFLPISIEDSQWSELPDGMRKTKYLLTHGQSFEANKGQPISSHTERSQLEPLFYGGCLSHLILLFERGI
jgi:hypothetical protein